MRETEKVSDALADHWVYRLLPKSLWPYAQLARWERPIGWQLLLWPCLWSLALAGRYYYLRHEFFAEPPTYPLIGTAPEAGWSVLIFYSALFIIGAILMRGAGCTYNDLVDQNIDTKVTRTRSRPLPSGRVSRRAAIIFLALQLLIALAVLVQFNTYTIIVGLFSLLTIIIYPFMKRITWWPQLFLGLAFSWGALMGWSAIAGKIYPPAILLYLGSICWVIGYDTIYAHQDIEDDLLANVKSTARLFAGKTATALVVLYANAIAMFASTFYLVEISWPAYLALALGAMHMAWQVISLDINNPAKCLVLFKSNNLFGLIILSGIVLSAFA